MLTKRLLVVNILIPVLILFIVAGGWPYTLLISAALALAAWEYGRIFHTGGYSPSRGLLIAGVLALSLGRAVWGFQYVDLILGALVLAAMTVHVLAYERGKTQSAVDLGITLGGILYLGWLGAYLISLRNMPDGLWWTLLALPSVWLADSGAYLFGRRFGKHKLAPRLSPNKTWEGYLGGIFMGVVTTTLLAWLWQLRAPAVTPLVGLAIGLAVAILTPLGDLGESMFKRQFGLKDSGNLLPGHGGMMDRIDSWLWAGIICYYLIIGLG
ncbi:MAG: phosphatidate cytidylyltransferase [Anaerolineaceae bacterium]|nr:phosphatidate cytidylyltransferase [Anaerolineaceae bacterium]